LSIGWQRCPVRYPLSMSLEPILSIVIPTRNRPIQLESTLRNLLNIAGPELKIEIIVSDNSDYATKPIIQDQRIKWVRPKKNLETAEENLFFALDFAIGTYIWPLGDDDVVLKNAFVELIKYCHEGNLDAMVWNTRNVGHDYQAVGWSRVMCSSEVLLLSYESFLERLGYWSIPAGISLTVFKRALINEDRKNQVQMLKSKIYSHVTFYALIFKEANFAFVNIDLVEYRTNMYDVSHSTTNHWTNYADSQGLSDRYFWLDGFVSHLNLLEKYSAIKSDFISRALDIGHFNHRIPLLEHIIEMLFDQIENDLAGRSRRKISSEEINRVTEYLERNAPSYSALLRSLKLLISSSSVSNKAEQNFLELKSRWITDRQSYPYRRYFRGRVHGYFVYETPLGWLALEQSGIERINFAPEIKYLNQLMLGIEFPNVQGIYTGATKEELFDQIRNKFLKKEQLLEMEQLQIVPNTFKILENNKYPKSFLRRAWERLPLRMKINLKRKILGH
jgi:glycosyltransferase involved in cell wall biosynthesis